MKTQKRINTSEAVSLLFAVGVMGLLIFSVGTNNVTMVRVLMPLALGASIQNTLTLRLELP